MNIQKKEQPLKKFHRKAPPMWVSAEITLLKEIPANSKVVVNGAFFILTKMNNKGRSTRTLIT
ncbi:MAG: hypothetical protein IPL74_18800 [Bacteroidetes bacterium]|nr:hypothetical protein [Bacteroidota bacterium]